MTTRTFERSTRLPCAAPHAFRWHARPGALERLTPPWERVQVLEGPTGLETGTRAVLRVRMGPFALRWVAVHRDYEAGRLFRDVQESGPFARWEHTHRVEPDGPEGARLTDHVEYALPLGRLGDLVAGPLVRSRLKRLFAYRHRVTADDVAAHARARAASQGKERPMKILLTGSSGLVGSALIPFLGGGGHQVMRLLRGPASEPGHAVWDPARGSLDAAPLEGLDAVVHLAGESIAGGRWTAARKERIRASRIDGTRLLCETLARLGRRPRVLVSASAIGYYGDRGEEALEEGSGPGKSFLAAVCRDWEAASDAARKAGIRVVNLRIGVVLSPRGGALRKMLPPFRMGVGGPVGDGRQVMSWIALDDLVGVILHALTTEALGGPVNAVAPGAVTNGEFARTLGRVLSRPAFLPMPGFAARLAFGQMADELLLASARVVPRRLTETGYPFRFPELEPALRHLLGR